MSGFVKLDCEMLQSSTWFDRDVRSVFTTALLMAKPMEFGESQPQLDVRSGNPTGWSVPPGWYGFVRAASIGILRQDGIELEAGLAALDRLGAPEAESRSRAHDGRRLVRVDGGYVVLNYMVYREKDHTSAERARRYRDRKRNSDNVTSRRDDVTGRDVTRNITDADARSASASDFSEGGVGATPSAADMRLPMTAAWQPTPETLESFRVGLIPEWAIPELVGRFRSHFQALVTDRATDAEWNQRCAKWAWKDWGNASKRPIKPAPHPNQAEDAADWVPLPAAAGAKK